MMGDNVKPMSYSEIKNNSNKQKVGIFIDCNNEFKNSKFVSELPFHEKIFEFYLITKNDFEYVKNDCFHDRIFLDIVIIFNYISDKSLLTSLFQKCKLFGIPILFFNDNVINLSSKKYDVIRFIANHSDVIIVSKLILRNLLNQYNSHILFIDESDRFLSDKLLNILVLYKRNKFTILFELYKLFLVINKKNRNISFIQFLNEKTYDIILKSRLFDVKWYISQYSDVNESNVSPIKHYIDVGVHNNYDPSPFFNTMEYIRNNLNIEINPLVHFILYNQSEFPLNYEELGRVNKYQSFNSKNKIYKELEFVKSNSKQLSFTDFEGFLSMSYLSPYIPTPFSSEHKRVFSFMDHIGKYLRNSLDKTNFNPLVSVIMPVFNNKNTIKSAINSVLNQTYEHIELIIIDDGSSDKTADFLNTLNDEKIKIIRNKKNSGVSNARNKGLNEANGEYIAYLDSDNLWDSNYIKTMVGAFLILDDAEALYSGQILYDHYGDNPIGMRFGTLNKSLLLNNSYIDLNSFCHKREILNEISSFNENLKCLEDWDFILRINSKFKIYSVPILLTKYYINNIGNRLSDEHFMVPFFLSEFNSTYDNNKIELKKKVSVIIPSYEVLDDLNECIMSILSLKNDLVDIIVVDNNSNDNVKNYLKDMESKNKIRLILNDVNYGFSYAINQGIMISDSNSDILILNNDAILTKNSLGYLQKYAYNIPKCGITVPQEILISGGTHNVKRHVPYADNFLNCDVTPSLIHKNISKVPVFHDGNILKLKFAPFFCTYIKREVINNSLGLDAELGRHYRSDRIFSNFLKFILEQNIYHISEARVFHKSQKATDVLRNNEEKFNYIFKKNQWEPELARKLGYKNALWDV